MVQTGEKDIVSPYYGVNIVVIETKNTLGLYKGSRCIHNLLNIIIKHGILKL